MIIYYSNYCEHSKNLIQKISQSQIKNDMHFICIDKRIKKPNGVTNIILEDGQEILLPPSVTKVPALLLLNRGNQVVFGNEINNYILPMKEKIQQKANVFNGEPSAFAFNGNNFGVTSDNFSFLDQNSDELSAKGNGGMRQQHHYASLDNNDFIETPPDNYTPDKVGSDTLEKYEQERNNI